MLWPVISKWPREFDELRARRTLVDADSQLAVLEHYTSALDLMRIERSATPEEADPDRIKAALPELLERVEVDEIAGTSPLSAVDATFELRRAQRYARLSAIARRVKLTELKKHLSVGEPVLIAHEIDDNILRNRLFFERASLDWIGLARHMRRAEIKALERSLERDLDDFTGLPRDPLVKRPTLDRRGAGEVAAPGESIAEAVVLFKKENPRNASKGRIEEAC